ncbi:MAG: hypothetical protein AAFO63_06685 [Pseudomonadota bacterium]
MAHLTLLGAVALPVSSVAIWLFWDTLATLSAAGLGHIYDPTRLNTVSRLIGFGVFFVGALIQAYGLLGLRETFLEGVAGTPLSPRGVGGFRRFAIVSLIMVLMGVVQHTVIVLLLSINDPSMPGALSFQFGSNEVGSLFMALLLIFVAQVFTVGQRAEEENSAFV